MKRKNRIMVGAVLWASLLMVSVVREPLGVANGETIVLPTTLSTAVRLNRTKLVATRSVAQKQVITFLGKSVSYQNGGVSRGQTVIDSNPRGMASTWGGKAIQSGSDNSNTHFIGHNPGVFNTLSHLKNGSVIVITDHKGLVKTYYVTEIYKVDDYGKGITNRVNYWSRITGTGGGERVTFQTCLTSTINLIVEAKAR